MAVKRQLSVISANINTKVFIHYSYLYHTAFFKDLEDDGLFSGHVYVIGGSANERLPENSSGIVTGINVGTGFLSRAEPASGPAVASS